MKGPDAVIFDFDGVIIYTPGISYAVWRESFRKSGIDFTHDDYSRLQGVRSKDKIPLVLKSHGRYSRELAQEILSRRERLKLDRIAGMSDKEFASLIVPGSLDFLRLLKGKGFRMALVTSSLESTARPSITRLGIEDLFNVQIFADDAERGKPEPDIFLVASRKLGVAPEECLVFEDTVNGIRGAKAAGMRVVALNTNDNRDVLAKENPDRIVDDFTGMTVESLGTLFRQ
jgi:beta-phosphoglucomutase